MAATSPHPRIVVFGNINMDAVVRVREFPGRGENRLGESVNFLEGGKGANQARALARLGGRAVLIGRVGKDQFGNTLRANLATEGVDTRQITVDPSVHTGMAFVFVSDGENRIISVLGANNRVTPAQVAHSRNVVRTSRMVLVQMGIPQSSVDAVISLSRRLGVLVFFDPTPIRGWLPKRWRDADIVSPNESELAVLLGSKTKITNVNRAAATVFKRSRVQMLVLKLGSRGCFLAQRNGEHWRIPAFKVKAIDPTGAGDAFSAAFARAYASGVPAPRAARFACAAGALAATKLGAAPSLPIFSSIKRTFPSAVPAMLK